MHAQPVDPSDPMLTQRGDLEGVSAFMRPPGRLIVAYPGCTDAALCYSCGKGCGTMALGDVLIPSCIKGTGRLVPAAGDIVTDLTLSRAFASLTNECTIVPPSLLRDAMANLACAEVAPPPSLLAALTLAVFGPVLLVWRVVVPPASRLQPGILHTGSYRGVLSRGSSWQGSPVFRT